ncbi:hypothetical protein SAMN05216257_1037 [Meinhardsimonia xiamenensis]|jgi:GNAT superfamily N-acetyltransferase|uniref:N-acetyltransferase domain-containing protein n=1 Tax=Meinhardsimonia xiamenensis TaxID=990712 RepID=A0A1G9C7N1_9RHOB|nr:GNAT family N-acetyltransferase [Meinhardsimonia xiamenensis]PRX38460.1 hypothetical protein LV81_00747 [Meinhardsimonia xiamenensis]SDK47666.1 hypothetical protein SAMN05216257_1037 [Meinhardsimonia xiamenensis]
MTIRLEVLTGEALEERLDDLARLRCEVFREWPYLYAGEEAYERAYLEHYRGEGQAVMVAAFVGDAMVGASTGAPLASHAPEFARPFEERGIAAETVFYFGESVLLPQYRGQGTGARFFELREEHARAQGFRIAAFCSVLREDTHPLRPPAWSGHDAFWRRMGYLPMQGAVARFSWTDIGNAVPTEKPLQFWSKLL